MATQILSGSIIGLTGLPVEVECDISSGLPNVIIVGLPDTAVQEAKERVKSAIKNSGLSFPKGRVAVNLAPADTPKSGTLYDLPIAIAILREAKTIECQNMADYLLVGELALDGRLRPVAGMLPIVEYAATRKVPNIIIPAENLREASLIKNINILPANNLSEVVRHLIGHKLISASNEEIEFEHNEDLDEVVDVADIAGNELAKRALIVAAAGHHNVLFTGPPGSGKTLLAKSLQNLLPQLSHEELLEVNKIYSIAGLINGGNFTALRPFRNPHHTSSRIALIGGGSTPKPGEVTLAHRGVLFLDEFPEFPRSTLEAMRQPLEDRMVTVSRARGSIRFPADFILIAAQNPCPCGNLTNPHTACQCSDGQIMRYRNRVSGPILDRIDLIIEVPHLPYSQLKVAKKHGASSAELREVIQKARLRQANRYQSAKTNANLKPAQIKKYCLLDEGAEKKIGEAVDKMHLSARAYHRILKVARTIADIEETEKINEIHIGEALQYRLKEQT